MLFYTFEIIIIIVTCHELYSRLKTILDISLIDSLHPNFLHFSSDFMEVKMYVYFTEHFIIRAYLMSGFIKDVTRTHARFRSCFLITQWKQYSYTWESLGSESTEHPSLLLLLLQLLILLPLLTPLNLW